MLKIHEDVQIAPASEFSHLTLQISRAYRAVKRREGMQLLDSEIFVVTKIRGYTHQLRKKGYG